MKAAQLDEYGEPLTLRDVPRPEAGPEQVVVEVYGSSVNPFDETVRRGAVKEFLPLELPVTAGGDVAGIISEVGPDVDDFKVGDKVYGQANAVSGNSGAMAEFAATRHGEVAKMPSNLDYDQAAALSLVGISAYIGIIEQAHVKKGQKVLIHGGSGGIGTVAIQMAKHLGAYVVATASGPGLDYAKKLGADEVIDYKSEKIADMVKDFDVVFHTVRGGQNFKESYRVLKKGGVLVSMTQQPDEALSSQYQVTATTFQTKVTTQNLDALRKLIEAGAVTAHIAKTYPLDQINEAYEDLRAAGNLGKIVIKVQ